MPKKSNQDYRHQEKALLRPEAGAQGGEQISKKSKAPKTYRYDSSLAPELCWDESAAAAQADKILQEIQEAKTVAQARALATQLQKLKKPFLNWTGKAERAAFDVPTLPLFVHERLSTTAILDTLERHKRDRTGTLDLFGEGDKSIGEKLQGAYEHMNGWQNRLILGDSLQVMNSLLEYERLGGQVQMVYMDPPYGIKFGSNFQPYVRKREVKDGDDAHITREPEMVQAYRDTWELGIHSWLTYMRDRLLLVREMLSDSGSCFVQISDEHVHFVRNIMDEVFGKENFVSVISYATTSGFETSTISRAGDYIVWYAKNKLRLKYRPLYVEKVFGGEGSSSAKRIELADGTRMTIAEWEKKNHCKFNYATRPEGARLYSLDNLTSQNPPKEPQPFEFEGRTYYPSRSNHWKANYPAGMKRLLENKRLGASENTLGFIRYFNDFSVMQLNNLWKDTLGQNQYGAGGKTYAVQTGLTLIQRCMLMTTDPGDLVFDPTCGSGTTAYVAEQWGRRWITTDVSRVPLSLARQRLLTATYPYYQLKSTSPSGGFVYARKQNKKGEEVGGIVPHVTLKSIANNEPPQEEVLVDKPETNNKIARTTGPFCVEAVMPLPLSPLATDNADNADNLQVAESSSYDHIARMIKVLQLAPVLRLPNNKTATLKNICPMAKSLNLHAEATINDAQTANIAIVFGPTNAAIGERTIIEAAKEANIRNYAHLYIIAFAIDPKTRTTVEGLESISGVSGVFVQANTDLAMGDMLKNMRTSQVFSVSGLPDITLKQCGTTDNEPLYQVTLRGLDLYDPISGDTESKDGNDVPCWMLDTDYDGQCFRAGQVFFPRTSAWESIKKAVQTEFADSVWDKLAGNTSEPFIMGDQKQIAVKVIDDRGNELLVVKTIKEVEG